MILLITNTNINKIINKLTQKRIIKIINPFAQKGQSGFKYFLKTVFGLYSMYYTFLLYFVHIFIKIKYFNRKGKEVSFQILSSIINNIENILINN